MKSYPFPCLENRFAPWATRIPQVAEALTRLAADRHNIYDLKFLWGLKLPNKMIDEIITRYNDKQISSIADYLTELITPPKQVKSKGLSSLRSKLNSTVFI